MKTTSIPARQAIRRSSVAGTLTMTAVTWTSVEVGTATTAAATDVAIGRLQLEARSTVDRATWLVGAPWLVLLVAVPAGFDPAGTLAFEPLKTSVLRAGAAIAAAAWLIRRNSRTDRVDVGAHPIIRLSLVFIGLAAV